jgi:hypothetical protein
MREHLGPKDHGLKAHNEHFEPGLPQKPDQPSKQGRRPACARSGHHTPRFGAGLESAPPTLYVGIREY